VSEDRSDQAGNDERQGGDHTKLGCGGLGHCRSLGAYNQHALRQSYGTLTTRWKIAIVAIVADNAIRRWRDARSGCRGYPARGCRR
jgi:hypothetical protein